MEGELIRAFVVKSKDQIIKNGLNIQNPKWHPYSEKGFPPGLFFTRPTDASNIPWCENFARDIATSVKSVPLLIPAVAIITIDRQIYPTLEKIYSYKREEPSLDDGRITSFRLTTWELFLKYNEMIIDGQYLTPGSVEKFHPKIGLLDGDSFCYTSFDHFKRTDI